MVDQCPACDSRRVEKVIYFGLPGRLCMDCDCLSGLAAYAPAVATETPDGPQFMFMVYCGSYWRALWHWLFGGHGGEEE